MSTNKVVTPKKIMNEIFLVTMLIQKEYPALYEHLSETPLFLSYNEKKISIVDFEQYLESLKMQLSAFKKNSIMAIIAKMNV